MLIGVVGKPSSGKSTFFNAATEQDVPMAAYPFTTIEANRAMGYVRVKRVDKEFNVVATPKHGFVKGDYRFVPVELVDVAGLVPGAHEGKGRGNQFLSDLSRADVLIHVVDASGSTNEKGDAVPPGSHSPEDDVLFLEQEIDLWFLGIINKHWGKLSKTPLESKAKAVTALTQNLSGVGANEKQIEKTLSETGLIEKRFADWSEDEKKGFAVLLRKKSKPIIIAANKMDLPSARENIEKLKKRFPEKMVVPCSGIAELTLKKAAKDCAIEYIPGESSFGVKRELNEKQKKGLDYIRENVLEKFGSAGIQEVLEKAVFGLLKYIAIVPGSTKGFVDSKGNTMADCFLMPPNSTAVDFAFALHTDFGEKFIKAVDVRTKLMVGKEHLLKHRDVIEIVHGK
jgi:ribosome-binding ATPase